MLQHPIETIIFDLDGTLRHNIPSAEEVQFQFAVQQGITNSADKQLIGARWVHYYWAQSPELFKDLEEYGEMNDDFWEHYSFRYLKSIEATDQEATKLAQKLFLHMKKEFNPVDSVYPCVHETLGILKNSGYTLGLISNRSNPCEEQCETLGLLEFFDFSYVAAEVDAWKPDPKIFNRAFEITQSYRENTIYVGDNYFSDILGAKNAGIQPVLLDPKSIFPDADCTIIRTIRELTSLLL